MSTLPTVYFSDWKEFATELHTAFQQEAIDGGIIRITKDLVKNNFPISLLPEGWDSSQTKGIYLGPDPKRYQRTNEMPIVYISVIATAIIAHPSIRVPYIVRLDANAGNYIKGDAPSEEQAHANAAEIMNALEQSLMQLDIRAGIIE